MRIKDKKEEIELYLAELESILPKSYEAYNSIEKKAACERYFEKIIEACVDLSFLVVKENKFKIPVDEKGVFDILYENKIITDITREKLKEAKGMGNIIAHEYGEIDDKIVFESITTELLEDVKSFLGELKK